MRQGCNFSFKDEVSCASHLNVFAKYFAEYMVQHNIKLSVQYTLQYG